MKKYFSIFSVILFVLILLLSFASCRAAGAKEDLTIGVTILDADGERINVSQITCTLGGDMQFRSSVMGGRSQSVKWSVSGGNSADTSIDNSGKLSVGASELAGAILTVKVTYTKDSNFFSTIEVRCVTPGIPPDPPDDISAGPKYLITINPGFPEDGGTITSDKETAYAGELVTLTIEPAEGYELSSFNVVGNTKVTIASLKTRTFKMPASNVTIISAWRLDPWAGGSDDWVTKDGGIVLYSNGNFHPNIEIHLAGGVVLPTGTTDFTTNPNNGNKEDFGLQADNGGVSPTGGTKSIRRDSMNLFAAPGFEVDLSRVTAISFWIKALPRDNAPVLYVEEFGLGRNRRTSNNSYRVTAMNTVIGKEWQKVIIPLPARKAVFVDELFYVWGARHGDIWIDQIELITNEVVSMEIIMPEPEPINAYPCNTKISSLLKGLKFEFSYEGINEKGYLYDDINFEPWMGYPYTYNFTGDVTRHLTRVIPVPGGSSFELTVSLDSISKSKSIQIDELTDWMFSDFEYYYTESGFWFWGSGQWSGFGWAERPDANNRKYAMQCGINNEWMGMGRKGQNWDFTPFKSIAFWFAVDSNVSVPAPTEANPDARTGIRVRSESGYKFGLETGKEGTPSYKLFLSPELSVSEVNTFERFVFNMNEFISDDAEMTPITSADLSAVSGWRIVCSDKKNLSYTDDNGTHEGIDEWPNIAEIYALIE